MLAVVTLNEYDQVDVKPRCGSVLSTCRRLVLILSAHGVKSQLAKSVGLGALSGGQSRTVCMRDHVSACSRVTRARSGGTTQGRIRRQDRRTGTDDMRLLLSSQS